GGNLVVGREPEQQQQVPEGLRCLVLRQQLANPCFELRPRSCRRIRLEDAAEVMNDARERLVAEALLVRETAPAQNAAATVVDERSSLAAEACLSDSRRSDERREVWSFLVGRAAPDRAQELELAVASKRKSTRRNSSH